MTDNSIKPLEATDNGWYHPKGDLPYLFIDTNFWAISPEDDKRNFNPVKP